MHIKLYFLDTMHLSGIASYKHGIVLYMRRRVEYGK